MTDLLREIAHCPNVEHCKTHPDSGHPCTAIVWSQPQELLAEQQVPEPWSGRLEEAPILFLGSNPSISIEEEYPRWSWPDEHITDFFVNRFGGGRKAWIREGRYWLSVEGTHSKRAVAFWSAIRLRAAELLEKDANQVMPGVHYTTSEVVHCKSRSEIGVAAAFDTCVGRYLRRMVAQSAARVIVSLGVHAGRAVRQTFNIPEAISVYGPMTVDTHERMFAFLPHPNAFMPKTFANRVAADELEQLRAFLRPSSQ